MLPKYSYTETLNNELSIQKSFNYREKKEKKMI